MPIRESPKWQSAVVFLVPDHESEEGMRGLLFFWKCLCPLPESWHSLHLLSWVELLVIIFGTLFSYLIHILLPDTNWAELRAAQAAQGTSIARNFHEVLFYPPIIFLDCANIFSCVLFSLITCFSSFLKEKFCLICLPLKCRKDHFINY